MPAKLTYAIGDIHGCYTKLNNLLKNCMQHCGEHEFRVVFLGDYIDRGKRSREVIELLMRTQTYAPRRVTCLRGNHDELLVNAAAGGDPGVWLANGGDTTLASYGVEEAGEIPRQHLDWMAALPLSSSDAKRFFVHAGVQPGIPLAQQTKDTLLWIREPFLSDPTDHGLFIVHGHTPQETGRPDLRANRVNVDTGAVYGGPLTAAVFDEKAMRPRAFITDQGTVTRAPEIRVADDA
jgi:serine/threonine protein phosphatase 1